MNSNKRQITYYQAGFSLVEIMVGLVIGLLVTLVIMQVFSVFEGQKRTTMGTADAQTNGSIALYTIKRELQMAGYGLLPSGDPSIPDSAIECTSVTIDAATGIGGISPVTITDGGAAGASDSITIRYSTADTGGIPSRITGVSGSDANLDNNLGCQNPGIALTINGNACYLTNVTGLSAPATSPASISLQATTGVVSGASIACLGEWREVTYRTNDGNLERLSHTAPPPPTAPDFQPSVTDIVNIQAQYGIGDPTAVNPNRIVQWVDATGTWAAPSAADRNRIKAVRVAVVARNPLFEKEEVNLSYGGKSCSSLVFDNPTGVCSWSANSASPDIPSPAPAIDLSGDSNWLHYRYRVFETIIPLRNVIWSKSTL